MLNYKTLFGELLVFKNENDCMTLRRGTHGKITIANIEINGEPLEQSRKNNFSVIYDEKNTFSAEEMIHFLNNYEEIVGDTY